MTPHQQQRLVDHYNDCALRALESAARNGFRDLHALQNDSDLELLRRRNDFRRLLQNLEMAA